MNDPLAWFWVGMSVGLSAGFIGGTMFGAKLWRMAWGSFGDEVVYEPNGQCNCIACREARGEEVDDVDNLNDADAWKRR